MSESNGVIDPNVVATLTITLKKNGMDIKGPADKLVMIRIIAEALKAIVSGNIQPDIVQAVAVPPSPILQG